MKRVTEVLNVNYAIAMEHHTLTSHLKSKKHVSRAQNKDSQGGLLKTWIQSSSNSTCSSDNTNITSNIEENSQLHHVIGSKREVFKAEMLWTLNLVRRRTIAPKIPVLFLIFCFPTLALPKSSVVAPENVHISQCMALPLTSRILCRKSLTVSQYLKYCVFKGQGILVFG